MVASAWRSVGRGMVATVVVGVMAAGPSACTTSSPVVRHLSADHEMMTEAGRSQQMLSVVIMLHGKYKTLDPQRWRELLDRSAELNRKAVSLTLARLTAVSGSDSRADRFYADAQGEEAALKADREQLLDDVAAALPAAQ